MIKPILSWVSNFDTIKAAVLILVAMLSSWYDLKNEVKTAHVELTSYQKESTIHFNALEAKTDRNTRDIDTLTRDIKEDIRDIRRSVKK